MLYITWPGENQEKLLARSMASVKQWHPELPIHHEALPSGTLLDKARMYDITPFRETLFLDTDTVVLGRLDYGFDRARRHGFACCICECPYARRFPSLNLSDVEELPNPSGKPWQIRTGRSDIVEYNTGVIFFTTLAKTFFDTWSSSAKHLDSQLVFRRNGEKTVMPLNDQASFAFAVHQDNDPFVLPLNWNFRPRWHSSMFGPIKVFHDYSDVSPGLIEWNKQQTAPDAIIDFARTQLEVS